MDEESRAVQPEIRHHHLQSHTGLLQLLDDPRGMNSLQMQSHHIKTLTYLQLLGTANFFRYIGNFGCLSEIPAAELSLFQMEIYRGFWHYTNNKILDLLDTVFFVLCKKQSHVTFLHVHHHSLMVLVLWIFGKYFPGFEGGIVGLCNTIVHTVMYFYYFLAALGPNYRKYLWWKSYLTLMQIVQFVIIITFLITSLCTCGEFNKYLVGFIIAEAMFNLYLFSAFYFKSYGKRKTSNSIENNNYHVKTE